MGVFDWDSIIGEEVTGIAHSSEALEDTVALDICAPRRSDWLTGADQSLHADPDQFLWAV